MDGSPDKHVNFHGCKVIQLVADGETGRMMPPMFTIAGPCNYTEEDKKDFKIMMRTKEQSLCMKLPPMGQFDWPDYRAFETCPRCCVRAKPGTKHRHWLVYQPLLQYTGASPDDETTQVGLGIRFVCRLMCEGCFESMVEDEYLQVRTGPSVMERVPLLDAIEKQGPITWLFDGRPRASSRADPMNAYDLYQIWEHTGTWQALSDRFGESLQQSTGEHGISGKVVAQRTRDPSTFWEMEQIPIKEGRKCDGVNCSNVHGNRMQPPEPGKRKGKKIRLQECTGCYEAMYCSEQCQRASWPGHKDQCREIQRKRKEDEKQKTAREKMNEEAKMEAALASFVPLDITPQGGGAKKKKGKKGGGKKKKGKK